MNKVCLSGRIANDLDMRTTVNGKNVLDISVAIDEGKNQKGEKITVFVPVTVWEASAKYLSDYAHKGTIIDVVGRIKADSYEQDGQKRKKVYVTAESVKILAQPQEKKEQSHFDEMPSKSSQTLDIEPDELPFY